MSYNRERAERVELAELAGLEPFRPIATLLKNITVEARTNIREIIKRDYLKDDIIANVFRNNSKL